jgi:hypothetical protein
LNFVINSVFVLEKKEKPAGVELCQAQVELGLDKLANLSSHSIQKEIEIDS